MRIIAFILGVSLLVSIASAQQEIRHVDFKNFTYPLNGYILGHNSLQWLSPTQRAGTKLRSIHLAKGAELNKVSSFHVDGREYGQYEGFTFESVKYADLTGDGQDEAIVDLLYHSGGTQTTDYVYIYSFVKHHPRLLAFCHTGDRAYMGLYGVYGRKGMLVFELLDPDKQRGDCCSSGIIVKRYKWNDGHFAKTGPDQRRALKQNE